MLIHKSFVVFENINLQSSTLLNRLEIGRSVLAKRADEVVGKLTLIVYEAADGANVALLPCYLRLGLNVILVIGIGHRFSIGDDSCLGYRADEHSVSIEVNVAFYLKRHK